MNICAKFVRTVFCVFCISLFYASLSAELLIFKKTIQAVDNKDPNKDNIYNIIIKYQWPMCTTSKLSLKEKQELFIPNGDNNEEVFIQKKIHALPQGTNYFVVFIPTVIYELFCLSDNTLFNETKDAANGIGSVTRGLIDTDDLEVENTIESKDEIIQKFIDINKAPATKNCFFDINQKLFNYLKPKVKDFTQLKLDGFFEDSAKLDELIKDLISKAVTLNNDERFKYEENLKRAKRSNETLADLYYDFHDSRKAISWLEKPSVVSLLAIIVNQELTARKNNIAFLFRAIKEHKALTISEKREVSKQPALDEPLELELKPDIPLEAQIKGSDFALRSLSYGNSLLGAILRDPGAGAFMYLMEQEKGYVIKVDKKNFVFGNLSKLFFISPLITCAALFSSGDLSHSRSRVVGHNRVVEGGEKIPQLIKGFYEDENVVCDKSGLFYEEGDATRHVSKLLRYISGNSIVLEYKLKDGAGQWVSESTHEQISGTQSSAELFSTIHAVGKWKEFHKQPSLYKKLYQLKAQLNKLKQKLGQLSKKLTLLQTKLAKRK